MAFKPNKKGVVTGTKNNDKINWLTSWTKTITVNAGNGNDTINFKKSKYKNKLNGQDGNDVIYGGTNIDTINGGNGNDTLYGYNGNDIIYAGNGKDQIWAGNGNDKIYGQYGNNTLNGETGNDTIYSGTGNETINGGKSSNSLYFSKNGGNDTVLNGGGTDTLIFSNENNINNIKAKYSGNDVVLTYNGGTITLKDYQKLEHSAKYIQVGNTKKQIYNLFETIHKIGTNGNDVLKGTNKNDIIHGKLGEDTIYGYGGNDILESFIDAYIEGGDGDDYINTEYGFSTLYGGDGNDSIYASKCHNEVYGEDGNDYISFGYASYINGGNGDDTIRNNSLDYILEGSTIYGGEGNDSIDISSGYYNHIYTGDGNDTIEISGNNNIVQAGYGDDKIIISQYSTGVENILYGGAGWDIYEINFRGVLSGRTSNTIYDNAGDYDSIKINETKTSLSFYINVFKDESYDNDLIIYNKYDDKLTIQNYLTDGKIETIKSSDNYIINYNSLNSIIAEVGTWLSTRTYTDVQAVIDSGNTTDISDVISKFTTAWVSN